MLIGSNVSCADLAPDFILCMGPIARNNLFEVANRVSKSFLLSATTPELLMRVNLFFINLDGSFEAFAGGLKLSALLVNETKVVVRRRVRGAKCCGFQIFAG